MNGFNPDSDEFDGVLFRFWIRAASYPGGWPSEVAKALTHCTTPAEYRKALVELAEAKRINLPPSPEVELRNRVWKLKKGLDDTLKAAAETGRMMGAQFHRAEEAERVAKALADWIEHDVGAELPLSERDAEALAKIRQEGGKQC